MERNTCTPVNSTCALAASRGTSMLGGWEPDRHQGTGAKGQDKWGEQDQRSGTLFLGREGGKERRGKERGRGEKERGRGGEGKREGRREGGGSQVDKERPGLPKPQHPLPAPQVTGPSWGSNGHTGPTPPGHPRPGPRRLTLHISRTMAFSFSLRSSSQLSWSCRSRFSCTSRTCRGQGPGSGAEATRQASGRSP